MFIKQKVQINASGQVHIKHVGDNFFPRRCVPLSSPICYDGKTAVTDYAYSSSKRLVEVLFFGTRGHTASHIGYTLKSWPNDTDVWKRNGPHPTQSRANEFCSSPNLWFKSQRMLEADQISLKVELCIRATCRGFSLDHMPALSSVQQCRKMHTHEYSSNIGSPHR